MLWMELLVPFLVVLAATSCLTIAVTYATALDESWGRPLLGFLASSAGVALLTALGIFLKVSGLVGTAALYWTVWNLSFLMLALTSWFAISTAFLVTRSAMGTAMRAAFFILTGVSYLTVLVIGLMSREDLYFPYIGGIYAATALYLAICLAGALVIVGLRRRHLALENRKTLSRFVQIFLPLGSLFLADEFLRSASVALPWIPLLPLAPLALYTFVIVEIALRRRRHADPDAPVLDSVADAIAARCLASPLTRREREILVQLLIGGSNAAIAARLGIAANTVKNHVYNVFQKTGASSRGELLLLAGQLRHD